MFPLAFPLAVLRDNAQPGEWILDPYCGRGTTNFASRILGLPNLGIDSSPVAVATAKAKIVHVSPRSVVQMAARILREVPEPRYIPQDGFWQLAYAPTVLRDLCRLREGLLSRCESDSRIALCGLLLGALHGPLRKTGTPTYLSNQAPRTYAPKPQYAIKFWSQRDLRPPNVNILDVISARAERYYGNVPDATPGRIILADSRSGTAVRRLTATRHVRWVITSPPYYGMNTYIPDQWLRNWFVGGPDHVDYSSSGQLSHRNPEIFAAQMRQVWQNVGAACEPGANLVIRFGGLNDRPIDPLTILLNSLTGSGWQVHHNESAGLATAGKRQADSFLQSRPTCIEEHDVWAIWHGLDQ